MRVVLASSCAAALFLGGCGGGDEGDAPQRNASLEKVQLANCTDWKRGTIRERYGTIEDIRSFASGPAGDNPGGHGATLEDDKAYRLFENTCKNDYARGFKLYKLYTRAAGFSNR